MTREARGGARTGRAQAGRVVPGMIVGGLVAVIVLLWIVAPYLRDDWWMDRIVRIVALDWRDFGEERARSRLEYELDHRAIGMHVGDEDCTLRATAVGLRQVHCGWQVRLDVPALGLHVPLSFGSEVTITAEGDLQP